MSRTNQYYTIICGNFLTLGYGVVMAWASPVIPLLLSDGTPLQVYGKLTEDEISWMSACLALGNIVGSIIGFVADRYGRKVAMYVTVIPLLINWIMIIFAKTALELMIARFFGGLSGSSAFVIIPIYVTEIAENEIRGSLGSVMHFTSNIGLVIGYACGGYMDYYLSAYLGVIFPLLFIVGFSFVPETPAFLASKDKVIEAEKSLKYFRGYKSHADKFSVKFVDELEFLKTEAINKNADDTKLHLNDFTNKAAKSALFIGIVVYVVVRGSGIYLLINYVGVIFAESGSSLSPNLSSIVVAVIFLAGTYVSIALADRAGRKILFVLSALLTGLCELVLGIYLYLQSLGVDMSSFTWLPIVCISGAFFNSSWGIISLPAVILNETLPIKIRSIVGMVLRALASVVSFMLFKYFYVLLNALNLYGCMWFFSGTCFLVLFLLVIFLPETKGKPLNEILEILKR